MNLDGGMESKAEGWYPRNTRIPANMGATENGGGGEARHTTGGSDGLYKMSRFQSVTCYKLGFPREFDDLGENVTFSKCDNWDQSVTKCGAMMKKG
jgi:hypothetical protein